MSLREIRNLTVDFPVAGGVLRAVETFHLDIDAGEILALVGEPGFGESIAMLALMGLLPPRAFWPIVAPSTDAIY